MSSDWQRLDRRIVPAAAARALVPLVPLGAAWLWWGQREWWSTITVAVLTALVLLKPAASVVAWAKIRYRVEPGDLVVESGFLVRTRKQVPRDRIRTVEVRSRFIDRIFGIALVAIGTGQHTGQDDELLLEGLARPEAEALRRTLLARSPDETAASTVLTLDPRWTGYHLLGAWTLAFPAAAFGLSYQGLQLAGANPDSWVGWYFATWIPSVPVEVWLTWTVLVFLGVGLIGSALAFAEGWWGYRLVREDEHTFIASRGLVTRRSITVERSRVRGATLRSSPISRLLGGARLTPVMTGLSTRQEWSEAAAVLPTTQLRVAQRIGDLLLDRDLLTAPWVTTSSRSTGTDWTSHPAAAGRRTLLRYLTGWVAAPAALLTAGATWWGWSWWWLLVLVPVTAVCLVAARSAYRWLGHRLTATELWARRGWLPRRTDVIEVAGISSASVAQTIFQRRLGLASVRVGTAAGERVYLVPDVPLGTALELAVRLGGPSFATLDGSLLSSAA